MANPLIWQIFLGIAFIAALTLGIYSVRTWRPWDIVAGFLVFFAAVGFLILAALSVHTRRAWLRQVSTLETRFADLERTNRLSLYGDPEEVPQVTPSLTSLRAELSRLLIDRGRVWRDTVPAGADQAAGTVSVTVTADAAAKHQITDRMVLYAFREAALPSGPKVPVGYVGQFIVAGVTDTGVTLRPSRALDANQVAQLNVGGATWSLYEKMPLDSHQVFTVPGSTGRTLTEGEPIFGTINEQEVREVFTAVQSNLPEGNQVPAERLEATINNIVRDGKRATATDEPEAVHLKVRFEKEFKVQVDQAAQPMPADAAAAAAAAPTQREFRQYFNASGLAEAPILQRSDDDFVTIRPGTVAVLHPEAANPLINDGTVTQIEPVFVRPLTDFDLALNTLFDRLVRTTQRIEAVRYNTATLQGAKAKVDQMTIYRQQERAKVEADVEKVTFELQQLTTLVDAVAQQLSEVRARMVTLYRQNLTLAEELTNAQRIIAEQIERSVAEAPRR